MTSPRKQWQAAFNAHGSEWLQANPRPGYSPEDKAINWMEKLIEWGTALQKDKADYIRANPPPERTETEARDIEKLKRLHRRLCRTTEEA